MAAVGKVRATKNHRGLGSLSGSSVAKLPVTQLVFLCWKIQIANQQEAVRQTPDGNEIFQTNKTVLYRRPGSWPGYHERSDGFYENASKLC